MIINLLVTILLLVSVAVSSVALMSPPYRTPRDGYRHRHGH
ncbi:hypothetical protein ACFQY4_29985 [Catellatospora bangladeshensis]|uniref:Uncharacterized protein n=1 Tax=Catellatospora bangladeshensis TaxID=310355 RepID=A0A8J3JDQ8_9ACTN|nr:hypothetical protein [Catellatospora bangladeshensis]GIF80759.1 hypothetical protein Cba03nite_21080 [Catellatospora bangladeshensis]